MSSITGVSSPNTLTQIVTVGGVTTTTTQTTTVAPTITDLGVPYAQSTAGLPSPSAPGDSEALIALILSKIQEAVGQSRNNQTLTEAQRTLGLLSNIQAGIAKYVIASQLMDNAKLAIKDLTAEKQTNAGQITSLYQQLTGDPNATSVSNVPPDASGSHGVYGTYLAKLSNYNSASQSLADAQTALGTAQNQQAADQKDASDYKTNTLNPTLSGLYNALVKIGNGTATATDQQTVTNALGTGNTGQIATTLAAYQSTATAGKAAYWTTNMVPLLNSLQNNVINANPVGNMSTAVNLLSTSGSGSASQQLSTYKGKIDTINSKISDPNNGYQATINAKQSDVNSKTSSMLAAARDLAPYLDYKSSNGSILTFTDPSSTNKTYTFDFTGLPLPTMNSTGQVTALLNPLNTLTARNIAIGDVSSPRSLLGMAAAAQKDNAAVLADALTALSAALGIAPRIDTGDDKDTRLENQSQDNRDREERDRLASNQRDVQNSIVETNSGAALAQRIQEMLENATVNTAASVAKGIVDVLFTLQQFSAESGRPDTTETLGGRGSRVRVPA
jgi:hypothetical protein